MFRLQLFSSQRYYAIKVLLFIACFIRYRLEKGLPSNEKKNPNWKSVNVNVKVIFVQTHVYRHTQHTLTQTFGSWQLHVFRRRLMEGGKRVKGWTRVNQGLAMMPPHSVTHKHTLSFMCNIYDFMHLPNQVVLCAVRGLKMETNKAWQVRWSVQWLQLNVEIEVHQNYPPLSSFWRDCPISLTW